MRFSRFLLAILLACNVIAAPASAGQSWFQQPQAEDPIRPDPQLTPGAILTSDPRVVCHPGYSKTVRHYSVEMSKQIFSEYGIRYI